MILHSYLFKRVTIVGVGLMGGSLGLALKKRRIAKEVVGFSPRKGALDVALEKKAIDIAEYDIQKAVKNSDLIILATPVQDIIQHLLNINPHLKRGCIVTDIGSSKVDIIEAAEKTLTNPAFFIGGHPLTGSELKGVEHSDPELFEGAVCILTPTEKTNQVARGKVKHLWIKLGCDVKFLPPEQHDEILAYISHLPHLLAFGLMETIPQAFLEFGSKGLKDTTRIAASSPRMWTDISITNSKNVLKALDELVRHLSFMRAAITAQDRKELEHHFTKAKEKRDSFYVEK